MQVRPVRVFLCVAAVFVISLSGHTSAVASGGQQDADAVIGRLKELLDGTETKIFLTPFPNSRSRILKVDGSSDFFLYIERGNLRGTDTIDQFYAALEAKDMTAANDIFIRQSLVSLRISDYGWNGLGVPLERQDGSGEFIEDRLYKNTEGLFGPADVSDEDSATFLEYIETILIPALEGGT